MHAVSNEATKKKMEKMNAREMRNVSLIVNVAVNFTPHSPVLTFWFSTQNWGIYFGKPTTDSLL